MLELMESHAAKGGMRLLYTRRPDAYQSYLAECPRAEMTLCLDDADRLRAQVVCLPREYYVDGQVCTLGYVTGLHKAQGAFVNLLRLFDAGFERSAASQFFCSVLDDNSEVLELFVKHDVLQEICAYTTYLINPRALRPLAALGRAAQPGQAQPQPGQLSPARQQPGQQQPAQAQAQPAQQHAARQQPALPQPQPQPQPQPLAFRRATPGDTERLLRFYQQQGPRYSFFPVISAVTDFPGLSITDFYLLQDANGIAAACALWDQRPFKQYIALGYQGIYRLASRCNPLLHALRYPQLPKVGTTASVAHLSFLLARADRPQATQLLLGEMSQAAQDYDCIVIGTIKDDPLDTTLKPLKTLKLTSHLCTLNLGSSALSFGKGNLSPNASNLEPNSSNLDLTQLTHPPHFACSLL